MKIRAVPTRLYYDWEGGCILFDRGEGKVLTVKFSNLDEKSDIRVTIYTFLFWDPDYYHMRRSREHDYTFQEYSFREFMRICDFWGGAMFTFNMNINSSHEIRLGEREETRTLGFIDIYERGEFYFSEDDYRGLWPGLTLRTMSDEYFLTVCDFARIFGREDLFHYDRPFYNEAFQMKILKNYIAYYKFIGKGSYKFEIGPVLGHIYERLGRLRKN